MLPLLLAVAAASYPVDVPAKLGDRVETAAKRSAVRVLLPSTITSPRRKTYADPVDARKGHYALSIGLAPGCRTATACFLGAFYGDRGAKTFGGSRVALAAGRTGYFTPTSCGASCSSPQIQWRERKVLYTLQVKVVADGKAAERRRMVALANSAIRKGAR